MEFRILGPLEVFENGQQIDLGGAKQRALLAILLVHANEVVSTDRLIDALWEEEAPETGRKALQVYVSQLRKVFGKERLQTKPPGYRLRVEQDELDLGRFQRLVGEGDIRKALSLWRGPPLSEFAYQRFAQTEIARLEELRLACLEDQIEAELAAGGHAQLVGELEALVREHPLRERLRGQLMLALYRAGRQAEALDVYQDARRALTDELGIEPGKPLRDLQQAILEQRSALDLETSVEAAPEARPQASTPVASAHAEQGTRPERKTVTVVHVRVAVTSGTDDHVDPEILRRVVSGAISDVTTAVEAHEGTIDAVTGDSISGIFGLPIVHEDDPSRAVRAADEIRRRLTALAEQVDSESTRRLEVRIGISTGEVMTGGAAGSRLGATGEPLTTAARLAQRAEQEEVVLDEATRRAVAARRDARRFTSPMVGRERERRRMHDAFEQAVGDRSCQLFTVLGVAGVGKSRLVQELLRDLAGRALVARGRCLPYGEGITFWPVLEAVKDVTGLDDTDTRDDAQSRLAALLPDEDDAALVAQRVTEVIGLTDATAGVEDGFRAVRTFFEALALHQPVVLVFDDVHWGEETFLELVEHLAGWSRGAPLLLLCMARPELLDVRPSWGGGKLNATSVLLEPLSDDECMQLVVNLVGEAHLAEEVEARIVEAAEGNPLFVEEVLSMLIDDGLLVRVNDRWTAAGDLTAFPVPPTIQALLAARLDQLSVDERMAIEPAAVEGKVFHESSVVQLVPQGAAISGALAALVRKELIRPEKTIFAGERAFRFRHLMIRDAAYEAISKEARAAYHEQHVEWLVQRTGGHSVEFDEIVGYHLEQAVRYRAELGQADDHSRVLGRHAAERLGTAGRRAFMRGDAPAGTNLISRAVALLPPDDPHRVELVPNVRVVQGMSDLSWADRVLTEAVEAASTTGDRRLASHALVQRGLLRLFTDPEVTPQELIGVANRAIGVFDELNDELGLARAWRLVAQAHYLGRHAGPSVEASEKARAHALLAGDRFEEGETVQWLAIALFLGPHPATEASERCERLLGEVQGDASLEVYVLGALAYLVAIQGRSAEAERLSARSLSVMKQLGEGWHFPAAVALLALWGEDPPAAERELRLGYNVLKRIGERAHFCTVATLLARVVYAQGRYDEAEELTRESEDASRPNDVECQIHWRGTRAKVLSRRGDLLAAEHLAREAVAFAEQSDFLSCHGDALCDLAEVLRISHRAQEAATAIEDAMALYARKGDTVSVERARAQLALLERAQAEQASGRA